MFQETLYDEPDVAVGEARVLSAPDVDSPEMGIGGCCHANGCSNDCVLDPYHDGPHRCHNHLR